MQFTHDAIIRVQQRIPFREFNYQLLARIGAEPETVQILYQYCVAEMAGGDVNADVKTGAGREVAYLAHRFGDDVAGQGTIWLCSSARGINTSG